MLCVTQEMSLLDNLVTINKGNLISWSGCDSHQDLGTADLQTGIIMTLTWGAELLSDIYNVSRIWNNRSYCFLSLLILHSHVMVISELQLMSANPFPIAIKLNKPKKLIFIFYFLLFWTNFWICLQTIFYTILHLKSTIQRFFTYKGRFFSW